MRAIWVASVTALLTWSLYACPVLAEPCERLVALAPSISELIYSLKLEDALVGVTRFSEYPEAVKSKPHVGGFLDPNIEAILALKPTLVILLVEHANTKAKLEAIGVPTLTLDHRSIEGILESAETLGKTCDCMKRAETLVLELKQQIHAVTARLTKAKSLRTMVVVSSNNEGEFLRNIYISGHDGYYSELLKLAGATNVYEGLTTGFPMLSAEGVLKLDPDAIIHIAFGQVSSSTELLKAWNSMPRLKAVRDKRVFILSEDYATIPGPRFVLLLEKIALLLHPTSTAPDLNTHG